MDILVIVPTEEERKNFIKVLALKNTHNHYRALKCGVGKISAAFVVQDFLSTNADMRVDMIALIGYVGGASGFTPGEIVVPDSCTVWDADTPYSAVFDELHVVYPLKGSENVTLLTGDSVVDRRTGRELERAYGPTVIYDMEGAAVAAVAKRERIPMIAIKVISDIPYHKPLLRHVGVEKFTPSNKDFYRFVDILEQF